MQTILERKGQMKIQEMAFVLVAIMIFFAIVALVYLRVRVSSLKEDVSLQRSDEAIETIRKITNTPEFISSKDCDNCADADKIILLKEKKDYQSFWNLDFLQIKIIYPKKPDKECTRANYPDCSTITLVNKTKNFGTAKSAFIALCRQEFSESGYRKCELGKIYAAGEEVK